MAFSCALSLIGLRKNYVHMCNLCCGQVHYIHYLNF
jgi:hypothetical protein